MKHGSKTFSGIKVSQTTPTEAQLAVINKFTRRPFTEDELYVGQLRLANNCIDRDRERFSEDFLQGLADTAVGKTFLFDHDKRESSESAIGKFFSVEMEKLPLSQAISETGVNLELPKGMSEVWFMSPWFYIPKAGIDPRQFAKIEAGVLDFASIGFRGEALVPVADDMGETLFWEYRGASETTEGSLVYLGAQYGAGMKWEHDQSKKNEPQGGNMLSELAKKLMKTFGKVFSEEAEKLHDEIKALFDELKDKVAALTTELAEKTAKITELTPLAGDGKAFRDDLVTQYVTSKAKLGEVTETPEAQDEVKKVAATYPIAFLKSEVKVLNTRVAEKFPDKGQLPGDMERDKSKQGGEKSWKEENPLVPKD